MDQVLERTGTGMIFYFTGTGNSKYIADKIAEMIGGRVLNIADYKSVFPRKTTIRKKLNRLLAKASIP